MVYTIEEVGELIPQLNTGSTIYDGKLWTVKSGTTFVSDDWGTTFTEYENNLPASSVNWWVHFTNNGTMLVSKSRQVFRAESPYTDFTYVLGLSTTQSILRKWGYTVDNDGIIYGVEYANYPDVEAGGYVNVMYIYKSIDDGLTWTKSDVLRHTDSKHFHQLKYNPFNDTLYITTGDENKRVFKSNDKAETWQEVIPTTYPSQDSNNIEYGGHTGIAFFSTGEILWGTDWQPRNPENDLYWNWFVRSQGHDVNSFVYQKMEKKYYGMCGDIVSDQFGNEAWIVLGDEFQESDVCPVLMYTNNKGVSWKPLVEIPASSNRNVRGLIMYGDTSLKDSPYIFLDVSEYGVVRISRNLKPKIPETPEIPEVKPSKVINEVEFFINHNNKIYEVELFNRDGAIKYNSTFIGN